MADPMKYSPPSFRILYLEDDSEAMALVRERLLYTHGFSFQLECFDRLEKAMERLEKGGIDGVLTDLGLADSRGLSTFFTLHTRFPRVPIVVLTGTYADEEIGLKAVQMGAQDYLIKGEVEGKVLVHVLRYAIECKRIELALQEANEQLKAKLKELEQLNRIRMDREERIIELKEEVKRLLARLGEKSQ